MSSATTKTRTHLHQTILRSTSETKNKQNSSPSSSTNTTPSPLTKKQHKRACSSPITDTFTQMNGSINIGYRTRPCHSPVRPNSLILPSIPPRASSRLINISHSDSQLDDKHFSRKNRSVKMSRTPEEDEQTTDDDTDQFYSAHSSKISTPMVQSLGSSSNISNSQPQLSFSCILDIDTEEQLKHKIKVLPPETDRKQNVRSA